MCGVERVDGGWSRATDGKEGRSLAAKAIISKDELIKKELKRLGKVFADLDGNQRKVVEPLLSTAAFLSVSLAELQESINENGYTEEYQNGANQFGVKQSENVKTHIAMTKNLTAIVKQLCDLVPPERKKESRLAALRRDE